MSGIIASLPSEFEVDTSQYAVCGFSAGAALTEGWGSEAICYGKYGLPKPSCVMLIYGAGITLGRDGAEELTAEYPPAFAIAGELDAICRDTMPAFKQRAEEAGIELFYKVYPDADHAFGHADGTGAEGWTEEAIRFWSRVSGKELS